MHNASDSEGRRMLDMRNQNMTDWMGKLSEAAKSRIICSISVFFNSNCFFKIREDTLESSHFFPKLMLLFRFEIHLRYQQQLL